MLESQNITNRSNKKTKEKTLITFWYFFNKNNLDARIRALNNAENEFTPFNKMYFNIIKVKNKSTLNYVSNTSL